MNNTAGVSLVNNNFDKVLAIISKEVTSDTDIKKNMEEIKKLLGYDDEHLNAFIDSYGIFWNNLPEIVFEVKTIKEFNIVINHFSQYISYMDNTVSFSLGDHGYTILVLYYLKIGKLYLESNV